jgi:hypothetical protein
VQPLAQVYPPEFFNPYGLTGDVVSAAADYSVIGATLGVFAAVLARQTTSELEVAYGEWGSIGAAAAAAVVLVVEGLGGQ